MKRLAVLLLLFSLPAYASPALIVMDAWANSNAMQRKIITEKINPLVRAFLDRGFPVINAANNADDVGGLSPLLALQNRMIRLPKDEEGKYWELSGKMLFRAVRKYKLTDFYYCGFSSSMCIMTRPSGIIKLEYNWHHSDLPWNDLKIYLVKDASAAETPAMHDAMCEFVRLNYGKVMTTAEALNSLGF